MRDKNCRLDMKAIFYESIPVRGSTQAMHPTTTISVLQQPYDEQLKADVPLQSVPEIDVLYNRSGTDIQFLKK